MFHWSSWLPEGFSPKDHGMDECKSLNPLKFVWMEECEKCFRKIKETLSDPELLICFDPNRQTFITTDASDVGTGGAISQITDGKEWIVAYWSKTLKLAERNYSTVERKNLTIINILENFQHLLLG